VIVLYITVIHITSLEKGTVIRMSAHNVWVDGRQRAPDRVIIIQEEDDE